MHSQTGGICCATTLLLLAAGCNSAPSLPQLPSAFLESAKGSFIVFAGECSGCTDLSRLTDKIGQREAIVVYVDRGKPAPMQKAGLPTALLPPAIYDAYHPEAIVPRLGFVRADGTVTLQRMEETYESFLAEP